MELEPVTIRDLRAYDLDLVRADLRAAYARDQYAPALVLLRMSIAAHLPWDSRFPSCWDDPFFLARYLYIRTELLALAHATDVRSDLVLLDVLIPQLDRLIDALMAAEENEPL